MTQVQSLWLCRLQAPVTMILGKSQESTCHSSPASAANGKCVDAQNCDFERWTVCAFDKQPMDVKVKFLDCLDTPWTDDLTVQE